MKLKPGSGLLAYKSQLDYFEKLGLFESAEDGLPFDAEVCDRFEVSLTESGAVVRFRTLAELFHGVFLLKDRVAPFVFTAESRFELCGAMIDNSRNSVTTLEKMKEYIAYSAAFGLNCIYLYNEDTFEIEGEPYFGYMRDGYTSADIRKICDFGRDFGIKVIPCIQTLAHLNQALRWNCYANVTDMGDTLLADEERTYELIEKMIATWRNATDAEYINIGMDEAHFLGRGKHADRFGHEPKFDIMCRHLRRVVSICEKYGFRPMMWSDMFFRIAFGGYYGDEGIDTALLSDIPRDLTLVYWDYYSTDGEKYEKQLAKHALFGNEICFAGGAWKWSGFTPSIDHSWRVSEKALEKVKKHGVGKVMVTCWGDDGADCLSGCVLPVLALYGAAAYADGEACRLEAERAVKAALGYTKDEFFALCAPSVTPCRNFTPYANPTKYLFYNDVLKGMFDKHTTEEFPRFYKQCGEKLARLAARGGRFSYLFDVQAKLCFVLELKSNVGVWLKTAYDSGDAKELKRLAEEVLPEIRCRTEAFYEAFRRGWMSESRSGGFDTHDLRIGGMLRRVLAAERTVNDYLSGAADAISELESERLYFDCRADGADKCLTIGMNCYRKTATSNIL